MLDAKLLLDLVDQRWQAHGSRCVALDPLEQKGCEGTALAKPTLPGPYNAKSRRVDVLAQLGDGQVERPQFFGSVLRS